MDKILKFKDGRKYTVVVETGKYYVCEKNIRFRRSDPDIESVTEKKPSEVEGKEWEDVQLEEEPQREEKKSVKANRRRTKKGE